MNKLIIIWTLITLTFLGAVIHSLKEEPIIEEECTLEDHRLCPINP
jgi:hypothetical protein